MSAEGPSVIPNPEPGERAFLILRERSEGEVPGVWLFAKQATREAR